MIIGMFNRDEYSKWIGITISREYSDVWIGDFSITLWHRFCYWMLYISRDGGGFCIGPIDVQWGD